MSEFKKWSKIRYVATRKQSKKKSNDPALLALLERTPSKGDLRKAEIIKAAIAVIHESGIEKLTFESIGKRLGIVRAHVAYHYKDKSDIVQKAIEYSLICGQQIVVNALKKAKNQKEQLIAYVEAPFDWVLKHPDQADLLLLNMYLARNSHSHAEIDNARKKIGMERLQIILGKKINSSHPFKNDLNTVIYSLMTGMLIEATSFHGKQRMKNIRDMKNLCTKTILKIYELNKRN